MPAHSRQSDRTATLVSDRDSIADATVLPPSIFGRHFRARRAASVRLMLIFEEAAETLPLLLHGAGGRNQARLAGSWMGQAGIPCWDLLGAGISSLFASRRAFLPEHAVFHRN